MAEISSGSFAPPQSAITPPSGGVTQPGQDATDADERAVRKAGESDTGGGSSAEQVQIEENGKEAAPADQSKDTTTEPSSSSGKSIDILV